MDEAAHWARRAAAIERCERVLSHGKAISMRARLAALIGDPGDPDGPGGCDLDAPPDMYGDGVVRQLEERVAGLLGKPAAAFFPTGTMAQQAALRCWAVRTGNPAVALHPLAHPEQHERDALQVLTGLRAVHTSTEPRPPSPAQIQAMPESFGTLMFELPLREAGFILPGWDELRAAVAAGRDRGAVVHFDGARLWECTEHFGQPLDQIAGLADSVYVSFYKSLGGMSGAAVAGPADLVAEAAAWRHRYGGNVFQQYPAALAAMDGLDRELPRLPAYVAHARVVAAALAESVPAWCRLRMLPEPPHTHQFAVWLPFAATVLEAACLRLEEEARISLFRRWAGTTVPGVAKTEVTISASALDWTAADIGEAVRTFVHFLECT
jgi:threonine aldolase